MAASCQGKCPESVSASVSVSENSRPETALVLVFCLNSHSHSHSHFPSTVLTGSADQHGFAYFPVLTAHLFQNDRMPGGVALIGRHVILARPAPEPEFLNQVQFGEYATADHGSTLSIR